MHQSVPGSERILVRSVNWLGDAVMTTPALLRLREARPKAHITLLCHEKVAGLWQGQPFLDQVLTFGNHDTLWTTARKVRAGQFHIGLAFPNSIRTALELWLGRVPQRIGYARSWRSLFLTRAVPPGSNYISMRKRSADECRELASRGGVQRPAIPREAHHVFHYLRLMPALGASAEFCAPQIQISEGEVGECRRKFGMTDSRPWFGLNPGAEYGSAKRWPAEHFVAAAIEVHKHTSCNWVVLGGRGDIDLAETISTRIRQHTSQVQEQSQVLNVAGKTSLRELVAVLKACRVVVTNDTGPMHVAYALNTPVVVPFGSTSPELTGPIFSEHARIVRSDVGCAPCFLRECPVDFRCLQGITPNAVAQAVLDLHRVARP